MVNFDFNFSSKFSKKKNYICLSVENSRHRDWSTSEGHRFLNFRGQDFSKNLKFSGNFSTIFCFNQRKVTLKCVVGGQRVPEHVPRAIQWIDQSRGQTINTFQSGRRVNKKVCDFNELFFYNFITLLINAIKIIIVNIILNVLCRQFS